MTIGIIGIGRFGALWAQLCASLSDVVVYDCASKDIVLPSHIKRASSLQEVCQCDILFLCVPISALKETCQSVLSYVSSKTVICDVSSVKVLPMQWMKEVFEDTQPLVFTHPLFGPDSVARTGVAGKKIVICDESHIDAQELVRQLSEQIGLQVLQTTAEDHDRQMARSQALVHFIGRALQPLHLQSQDIATPDYDRLLAMIDLVSHDTMELFYTMQQYNPYTKEIRNAFLGECARLEGSMRDMDQK